MKRIAKINFVHWVFLNFVVLALFGVVLRYMISFSIPQLNYMNILHAHSHFAFAGWVFLAFVLIFANKLPVQHQKSFSWIALLTILSSYFCFLSKREIFRFINHRLTDRIGSRGLRPRCVGRRVVA